jgi:hypothetical protein
VISACGSDSGSTKGIFSLTEVSGASSFAPGCNGAPQLGTNYRNSAVEPYLAVDPTNPAHLIGVWQQDRWSNAGSNGLLTGVSQDRGSTWSRTSAHLSRCTGGNSSNGGDYERASDPWVTFSPDGTAYQISVSFNSSNPGKAILVSRSTDGGLTWNEPWALASDTDSDFALDKPSITADPYNAHFVYAVWDRLSGLNSPDPTVVRGPTWFARMVNGTWGDAQIIHDPGSDAQTIANQIAVMPDGTLINLFLLITKASTATSERQVAIQRSANNGASWSQPIVIDHSLATAVTNTKDGHRIRSGVLIPDIGVDARTGTLYVVWEDSRFSGFTREGIALSVSRDGGLTWSTAVQVNQVLSAPAFSPAVRVLQSGKIGITHYDLRNDDPRDTASFVATYWLVTSADGGTTWQESVIGEPFDLRTALLGEAYFLGDYEGMSQAGDSFIPFFAATSASAGADRTDIFIQPAAMSQ